MLEGIAKELEQQVGKVLSFYLKDCPDLHRVAIKVEKVTESTVEGFIQQRIIVSKEAGILVNVVKGINSEEIRGTYAVTAATTANGRKVYLNMQNITAWSPAVPAEAATDKMPRFAYFKEKEMNHYHL